MAAAAGGTEDDDKGGDHDGGGQVATAAPPPKPESGSASSPLPLQATRAVGGWVGTVGGVGVMVAALRPVAARMAAAAGGTEDDDKGGDHDGGGEVATTAPPPKLESGSTSLPLPLQAIGAGAAVGQGVTVVVAVTQPMPLCSQHQLFSSEDQASMPTKCHCWVETLLQADMCTRPCASSCLHAQLGLPAPADEMRFPEMSHCCVGAASLHSESSMEPSSSMRSKHL